jgi:hypothetical protein
MQAIANSSRLFQLFFCFIFLIIGNKKVSAQAKTVDYCVLVTANVQKSPASIGLKWPVNAGALSYNVGRKSKYEKAFTSVATNLPGNSTGYTDNTVQAGVEYEYSVIRSHAGGFNAHGYLSSAIELPAVHNRGTLLLLIESNLKDSLKDEIHTLSLDLAGDGWKVIHRFVSKDSSPVYVAGVIAEAARWAKNPLRSLYLLGHVPVPYSGNYGKDSYYTVPPDGHPDHGGAWPADVFYGTTPALWTDNLTNEDGSRAQNKNYPKDGKYDQIELPDEVDYHIGRVDLSNMPKFGKSEVQLLKQYLKKSHDYRYDITKTVYRGLIDENFSASTGAFASTAWRNFSAFFGPENIRDRVENGVDYFINLKDTTYVFAYGTGGGSYTSAGGIGTTDDFVSKRGAMFNLLFGSYFGDWDVSNSFLRAPLASTENGLISGWSGRPWWNMHHMALGETAGFSTWVTQGNRNTYASTPFVNNVHIALMGDPSLRLFVVNPAASLTAQSATDKKSVNLSWIASQAPGLKGYYVYRSASPYGTFDLINNTPLIGTNFSDSSPFSGTTYYMVRAAILQQTPAGSYYNLSQGVFASASNLVGQNVSVLPTSNVTFNCYPNPANQQATIEFGNILPENPNLRLINHLGVEIQNIEISQGSRSIQLSVNDLPDGVYWVCYGGTAKKLLIAR